MAAEDMAGRLALGHRGVGRWMRAELWMGGRRAASVGYDAPKFRASALRQTLARSLTALALALAPSRRLLPSGT